MTNDPQTTDDNQLIDDIRILIVDDHAVVRDGLKALLSAEPGMVVVGAEYFPIKPASGSR